MTSKPVLPPVPAGLDTAGIALWKRMTGACEFEEWELHTLELACRQCDDLRLLDEAIRADGVVVAGSQGQTRLSAVVVEARQARLALVRLLGQVGLPSETSTGERSLTDSGRRAQRAATKRWAGAPHLPSGKGADRGETA